jgi:hypothetical protein
MREGQAIYRTESDSVKGHAGRMQVTARRHLWGDSSGEQTAIRDSPEVGVRREGKGGHTA